MEIAINWWAIVASVVASVIIGFVWYGPLFGKVWMREAGIKMPEKHESSSMTRPIVLSLVGALLMAYVLNHSLIFGNAYLGMSGVSAGLQGAFWVWLGFILPAMLSFVAWEGKSWKLLFINAGYWLTVLLAMGAILAGWQ